MRSRPMIITTSSVLLAVAGGTARLDAQDSTAVKVSGAQVFSFQQKVTVPVEPAVAYDLATGDLSGWWDHKFSQQPAQFCLEPRVGGGFWELFDNAGNGVRHAVVTWAQRGKRLRFEGPLGLAGSAVQAVMTYDFAPVAARPAGDAAPERSRPQAERPDVRAPSGGTELTLTVNVAGQIDPAWPQGVAQVWQHFLGRYRDYVVAFKTSGRSDDRPKQCGPR